MRRLGLTLPLLLLLGLPCLAGAQRYKWTGDSTYLMYAVCDNLPGQQVYDYANPAHQPVLVSHAVTGSSAFDPTYRDPTGDADWPWPKSVTPVWAINNDHSGTPCQPWAHWQDLTFGWWPTGPGTGTGAAYTYWVIYKQVNNYPSLSRLSDSNVAAPFTFYAPITANTNTNGTTIRNSSNAALSATWPGNANWSIVVVTILKGTGAVAYANFNGAGTQTPISGGLNVIGTWATGDPNGTYLNGQAAATTCCFTGSTNNTNTIFTLYDGQWVAYGMFNYALSSTQVNAFALNPFATLTIDAKQRRGSGVRGVGTRSGALASIIDNYWEDALCAC